MNKTLIASLLIAISAAVAAPAFASSGYGPAPSYNPLIGAPESQRGQSAQTIAADNAQQSGDARAESTGYGGVKNTHAESGSRVQADNARSIYSHN